MQIQTCTLTGTVYIYILHVLGISMKYEHKFVQNVELILVDKYSRFLSK